MKEFIVTPEHLALLKEVRIGGHYFGDFWVPIVDHQKPYGGQNVQINIAKIIGIHGRMNRQLVLNLDIDIRRARRRSRLKNRCRLDVFMGI